MCHCFVYFFFAENLLERDKYMSPIEAKEFGLIDEVIEKPPAEKSSNSWYYLQYIKCRDA